MALDYHIDLVVGRQPDRSGLTYQGGIGEDHALQLVGRPRADKPVEFAFVAAFVHVGESVSQGGLGQGPIVG